MRAQRWFYKMNHHLSHLPEFRNPLIVFMYCKKKNYPYLSFHNLIRILKAWIIKRELFPVKFQWLIFRKQVHGPFIFSVLFLILHLYTINSLQSFKMLVTLKHSSEHRYKRKTKCKCQYLQAKGWDHPMNRYDICQQSNIKF